MKKSRFLQVLILAVLLFIGGLLVIGNFNLNQKRKTLTRRYKALKEKVAKALQQKKNFESEISKTEDPEFLEKEAKEEYNLKWPGEKVAAFLIPKTPEKNKLRTEPRKSFWQKLFEKLGMK